MNKKINLNYELFVDPGINTGWSFFTGEVIPSDIGIIKTDKLTRQTRENYIRFMGELFSNLLNDKEPSMVTIEEPEFWGASFKSYTSITTGALFHLNAVVYTFCDRCAIQSIPFKLVKAREWKKNMSKEATAKRVELITGKKYDNEHILDSIGMALSTDKDIWLLKR
jgi:hypothetical protein